MYEYNAKVISVHDGDTCTVDIDLGFKTWARGMVLRLDGINAPEMPTPEGKAAQVFLASVIQDQQVIVRTRKSSGLNPADKEEKYGRWLATVLTLPPAGINVNELMVTKGFAVAKQYLESV
jgi:micrococcal nuclease